MIHHFINNNGKEVKRKTSYDSIESAKKEIIFWQNIKDAKFTTIKFQIIDKITGKEKFIVG